MNKNIFKNIIVTISVASCLASPSTASCLAPLHGAVRLNDAERNYVSNLTKKIETIAQFLSDTFITFTDKNDNTPYYLYVTELNDEIDEFENTILKPLAEEICKAKISGSKPYYDGLTLVYDVLTGFLAKINAIRPTLSKYIDKDSASAANLVKELKPYLADLANPQVLADLQKKVDQLYHLMITAGESSISNQIKDIKDILNSSQVNPALKRRIDPLVIFTCLSTKLRYNKIRGKK